MNRLANWATGSCSAVKICRMYPVRGILGQAPGSYGGGGARFPSPQIGGGYVSDGGSNYGNNQMTPAGGNYGSNYGSNNYGSNNYGGNQMSDDYGGNQMGGNFGGNQGSGSYGGNQMSGNYGGGNYGGNQMSDNYGGNQMSDNYGGDQMADNYGGNQVSSNYESNQVSGGYAGGNQMSGGYGGGNQMSGGYGGGNQMSGGYGGGNQMSGGYGGSNQMPGNYGGNQMSGNYESNPVQSGNYGNSQVRSGNFGSNQRSSNFGSNQKSGNFGGNQTAGNFGGNQKSGNFGGNQSSGNFGGNQVKSGNFGGNQVKSGNFGGNQMRSGNFGGNQMRSSGFGSNRMSSGFAGSPARAGNFGKRQMGIGFRNRPIQQLAPISYPELPMKLPRPFNMPFVPTKMPRPLMETLSRPLPPPFLLGGKHKRFFDDDIPPYPPAKRPRPAPVGPVLPPKVKNNFLVPVSEGTEKITMDIWNYFLSAKMEDADVKRKLRLRKCIMAIVGNAFPNCSLFIVGSSMTGFATKGSDVDMCLMISQEEIDQRRDASIILNSISKALRQCSCFDHRQVIKAKVPILKFFDKVSGVECDLNINNLVGVRNTHLMRFYAYMDWRVRPLMLFIKKWARYHDINDASKQTISSYSLTLMLIHYLQVGVSPRVLPCLQEDKPELFDLTLDVRQLSLNFEPYLDFVSENRATLGELFLGFLNYYANQFSYEDQIISIRLGRILPFDEVSGQGNAMQWKHLNIEEPFEKTNTARSVYDKFVFTRVLRVFQNSYKTLDKSRDLEHILLRPF
ncbi:hypothetical protein BsWGS_04809 [Bradybaena similaris]